MTKKKMKSRTKSKKRADLFFYCVMMALPVLQFCLMWIGTNTNSIVLSFKEYGLDYSYTWTIANFLEVIERIISDAGVQKSLLTSLFFWFCATCLTIPVSLLISFYFYKRYKFSNVLKNIFFLPSVVAGVVSVTVFFYLADRGYPLLMKQLFDMEVTGLLANNQTQLGTLLFYNIFYSLSGGFLFFSSAMSGVDDSISEAAQVDGASTMQEFFHITLPMIYPTLSVWFISGIATIFVSDFSMYAFFKTAGSTQMTSMGYYFVVGLTSQPETRYPFYAAFGLVLTVFACLIVFPLRALSNRIDPMRDVDGAIAAKKRLKKEAKQNG